MPINYSCCGLCPQEPLADVQLRAQTVRLLLLFNFLSLGMLLHYDSLAQRSSAIEINPFLRTDSYPGFLYRIDGVIHDSINLRGTSWGVNISYNLPVSRSSILKLGLGYYRHRFDKIININTLFSESDSRNIYFPGAYIVYSTDKYFYNIISVNTSFEKQFISKKEIQVSGGLQLANHITFSQNYHITAPYPLGPAQGRYTQNKLRYFGSSVSVYFSMMKKFGAIQIGPSLIIPVFEGWKQDAVFPGENNASMRTKWLRGIGGGLLIRIPLTLVAKPAGSGKLK